MLAVAPRPRWEEVSHALVLIEMAVSAERIESWGRSPVRGEYGRLSLYGERCNIALTVPSDGSLAVKSVRLTGACSLCPRSLGAMLSAVEP